MIITLHYTEAVVRLSVKRFCWSRVGPLYILALLLVLVGVVTAIMRGDNSWLTGVFATILLMGLAMPVMMYRIQMRASLERYRALAHQSATLNGDVDSFVIESAAGSSKLTWQSISEIRRYDELWLLMLGNGGFFTVPLDGTTTAAQDYLIDRVKSHGGKVS
jgi:YcxB-like protein